MVDFMFGVSVNSDEKCQFYLMAGVKCQIYTKHKVVLSKHFTFE